MQVLVILKRANKMSSNIDKEIQILVNKYNYGDFNSVLKKCSKLLEIYPKNDFLWNLSGLSFQRIGNIKNSITSFQNAISINSNNHSAKNNLAISKSNKEFSKAENLLVSLIKENPNYVNALVNFANMKNETYFFDEAISTYEKVLKIEKNLPELHLNISNILQAKNQMDEAKNHLHKAIEINEFFTLADQNLSMLLDYSDESNNDHIDKMINKLKNPNLNNNDLINLHFALGKAYEDKKDYENSFKHFESGNKAKDKNSKFSLKYFENLAKDLKSFFLNLDISKIKQHSNKGGNKIFILGLPRSGTTLLEKIISSHSEVNSVSEIGYFYDLINKNIFSENSIDNNKINSLLYQDLDKKYDELLKFYNVKNKYIIDKTLTNFWYVGFIKIFFPKSKIIHSYRNPKDNCLSIYKNLFKTNEAWLYNQNNMGEYYLIYNEMMKFWNEIFEGEIYNNKYEDLVNNKDSKTKEIIKFCNLDWDEKCLNHHKNLNPIKTLSINQANKAIYKTSINSSKFYNDKLTELYSILDRVS